MPCRVMDASPRSSFSHPAVRAAALHRSNTSMTIMRPPQQGHGGRKSSGLVGIAGGWRGTATSRSSRAPREVGLAGGAGEQAVVPDAMEAARQDMEQEPADELVGGERHDLLAVRAVAAVVLVAEGDAVLVECDQAAVRDRHPVGVA